MTGRSAPADGARGADRDGSFGPPEVVVVGAASRDIAPDDRRGWRLGGGVSYGALAAARLGLRTAALVGVDDEAASADELRVLRAAGVDVRRVVLERGPVFENIERPDGRVQVCHSTADPLPPAAVPREWLNAPNWLLAPVAGELADAWSRVPPDAATVAVGWQGFIREMTPGERVRRVAPSASAVIGRADIIGVSRDDLDRNVRLDELCHLLRNGASLAITQGLLGGIVVEVGEPGRHRMRRYPAVPTRVVVDPTGAGDVFLAALLASRWAARPAGQRPENGSDLLLAATAASLVIEGRGLAGVPHRSAVRRRIAEFVGGNAGPRER